MERINFLRDSVVQAMTEYGDYLCGSNVPNFDYRVVTDEEHDKYELFAVDREQNDYYTIFHADLISGKIWIQEDNTEDGFANLLLDKGVDKQEVVLAYYPEYHRQYTAFATA